MPYANPCGFSLHFAKLYDCVIIHANTTHIADIMIKDKFHKSISQN